MIRELLRTPAVALFIAISATFARGDDRPALLQVGVAQMDITPPVGFPMAGYYHERLATGMIDPLKAKAIVFRDGDQAAALVVCDSIGIATDLSREVRKRAAETTESRHLTSLSQQRIRTPRRII